MWRADMWQWRRVILGRISISDGAGKWQKGWESYVCTGLHAPKGKVTCGAGCLMWG